jgi:hypothetical protein
LYVMRQVESISPVVQDLLQVLSNFRGDFLIDQHAAFVALTRSLLRRGEVFDELKRMTPPQTEEQFERVKVIANEYGALIGQLSELDHTLVEYARGLPRGRPPGTTEAGS